MNFGIRIAVTVGLAAICVFSGFAQFPETDDIRGAFEKEHYTAVWKYYSDLLKKDSLNTDLNYKMGICYLNSRSQKAAAIRYFKKAIGSKTTPPESYKLLADAFYSIADYEAAAENYSNYKKILIENGSKGIFSLGEISSRIELCKVSKELRELKGSVAVFEMNRSLSKGKYSSVLRDHPVHTSLSSIETTRPKKTEAILFDRDLYEVQDPLTPVFDPESRKWDTSTVLMETTIGTSSDGQIILVYRSDGGEQNLYTAVLNGNEWKDLERLDKTIGNRSWEPNEFISVDGKEMYFASNRPGGFGGMDIYKCIKQTNGEWSKAKNMGANINSRFDEEAPFVHPDGTTLYFSSNRLRSNGYFDNFMTVFADSGSWSIPVNVGYPSFKSREKERKNKKIDAADNYIVTFNNQKKTRITVIKRMINDRNGKIPPYTEITVANNETGEVTGIYHPDPGTGKFSCIIPSEKNSNVTYEAEGYLFYSENIDVSKEPDFYKTENTIRLVPVEEGSKVILDNIFFGNGSSIVKQASDPELTRVLKLLTTYPKAKVEISTTLEQKSNSEEIKWADNKLKAILNFLYEKGIPKENVESRVYLKSESKKRKAKNKDMTGFGKLELEILHMN
jgi:Tol biopolymer transport system component